MTAQLQLFEPPPRLPRDADLAGLSAQQRRTVRQARRIAEGIHPLRQVGLLGGTARCGDCEHAQRQGYHSRDYWKCEIFGITHGAGSDLRLWWPACVDFEATTKASDGFLAVAKTLSRPRRPISDVILNERGKASL